MALAIETPRKSLQGIRDLRDWLQVIDEMGELQIVRADGRRIDVLFFAAPVFDENGRVRGAIEVAGPARQVGRVARHAPGLAQAPRIGQNMTLLVRDPVICVGAFPAQSG